MRVHAVGLVEVPDGSIYPALGRLERDGTHLATAGRLAVRPGAQVLPPDGLGTRAARPEGGGVACPRGRRRPAALPPHAGKSEGGSGMNLTIERYVLREPEAAAARAAGAPARDPTRSAGAPPRRRRRRRRARRGRGGRRARGRRSGLRRSRARPATWRLLAGAVAAAVTLLVIAVLQQREFRLERLGPGGLRPVGRRPRPDAAPRRSRADARLPRRRRPRCVRCRPPARLPALVAHLARGDGCDVAAPTA